MSDATQKCPVCGASLPARAKFCSECGSVTRAAAPSAGAATAASSNQMLPWFIAFVSVLAVFAAVIILAVRRPGPAAGPATSANAPFANGAPTDMRGTTDISQMTPREAADRLYDRIARASEAGDTAQVQFFAPMAIQAYQQVSPLDADARFHIGLIDLAAGNPAGASAQADSIERESRTHLFGPLLKARVAEAAGNTAALQQAYRQFLANYDSERAKNLEEYGQHNTLLTQTRTAAQQAGR